MGWIFSGVAFFYTLLSRLAVLRKNPDLISERIDSFQKENVEPWDKVIVPVIGVVLPAATMIVAGLDRRFLWSPSIPLWMQPAGLVLMILGGLFAQWAVMKNRFFSAVVRIQKDRGHTVVTSGPYRFVRHPGYAGGLLFNFFMPIALGSFWALVPTGLNIALTIIRTSLEDRTLILKLDGYAEYAARTKYRLIPGVW
jgi:protein-S-isoprenylcysteine O-methyltransferase Ste14